jgi:hypothetical protein
MLQKEGNKWSCTKKWTEGANILQNTWKTMSSCLKLWLMVTFNYFKLLNNTSKGTGNKWSGTKIWTKSVTQRQPGWEGQLSVLYKYKCQTEGHTTCTSILKPTPQQTEHRSYINIAKKIKLNWFPDNIYNFLNVCYYLCFCNNKELTLETPHLLLML